MNLNELLGIDPADPVAQAADTLVRADADLVDQLIRIRKDRGMTQQEVAEQMGVSQSAVAKFERASRDPRLSTLRRYALAVGATYRHMTSSRTSWDGWSEPSPSIEVHAVPSIEVDITWPAA